MCAHGCRVGKGSTVTKRFINRIALALLLAAAVLAGISIGIGMAPLILDTSIPQISLNTSVTGECSDEQMVRMNMTLIPITATASAEVYTGAVESAAPCYGSFDTYYTAIIFDPMQDDFFAELVQQFRTIREWYQLDDDQYAELMAAYVQAIPYDYNASIAVKYPVVTAVGGTGDCDDLSLLLAGLLAREGYDVTLLLYLDSGHMAVGIRSSNDSYAFPNTGGYAYIETTGGSLIVCGDYPMGMIQDSEMPTCIRIGNGTKTYAAGRESNALFQYVYATYHPDELGEKKHIVLNQQNGTKPAENMEVFTINAFDRGYLYRMLIEKSV
ncbi:MAG TPA: hypothetical protein O0X27_05955 [Methanocorpusculum sp.]|nr:hypothetical protein [Methanocorpusculum sp.]